MTDHLQQLIDARRACLLLAGYAAGESFAAILTEENRALVAALLDQFLRLDEKECRQREAGRKHGKKGAIHGKKGGRPRKPEKSK